MSKRETIQQEALDMAIKHKRCGLGISMGVGKTLIGLKYIDHFRKDNKPRVLVVAPKLSIFESWKDDSIKFGIDVDDLQFTTYLSLNKFNPNDYDYYIAMKYFWLILQVEY
jgi:superfamily II DNA or RNA helicase